MNYNIAFLVYTDFSSLSYYLSTNKFIDFTEPHKIKKDLKIGNSGNLKIANLNNSIS